MPPLPHLRVALVGPKGTGKTTFANVLAKDFGFTPMSLADPIKFSLMVCLNEFLRDQGLPPLLSLAALRDNKDAFRLGMQWLGTDIVRNLCNRPDHWIDILTARIDSSIQWADDEYRLHGIVVDDVRFLNEAAALKQKGFLLVRLRRPHGPSGMADSHESENQHREIITDLTLSIGGSPEDTAEVASIFASDLVCSADILSVAEPTPEMDALILAAEQRRTSEVKQILREIGGISGIQVAGRPARSREWSF